MKTICAVTSLVFIFGMILGCQTLEVRETVAPAGPVGEYLAKASTPNGEIEFALTLNADGTGVAESPMGIAEFTDAKIEGNRFAFDMILNSQMGAMEIAFNGSVEGDAISGTIGTQMGEMPFSGRRK